ncbi:ABC transporter permease [Amycolatopsis sp.]|jgi:putative ABC transport system permease protein|uniref:ABC transporter permease n=1 Tax=Amycolatopsis sp. TaxID=37632 RepID=UPI002E05B52B|nr:FtsX-like permease family protein [Amycolatopsis sp.]
MLRTTLAGLKSRLARLVLSSIAIVLGVAFVSGTLIMGDALSASLNDGFAKEARNVDVVVQPDYSGASASSAAKITQDTLATVRQVPGVASAGIRDRVSAAIIGSNGKAEDGSIAAMPDDPKLVPFDLTQGVFPASAGEVAVEKVTAESGRLAVGQQISVLDKDDKAIPLTISGIYDQGVNVGFGGKQVAVNTAGFAPFDEGYGADALVVSAQAGVDQQALADRVKTAVALPNFEVLTGTAFTADLLSRINRQASSITQFMLVFALIALVVASMVIYNTFTILIAQRTRELALLRCVGAERKQVFQGVLIEAVVIGFVASVIGLVLGIGLSAALQATVGSSTFGSEGAAVHVPVTLTTVLVSFAVGVLVTVLSAVLPARKATRVAPIEALRSQPDSQEEVARTSKKRIVAVVVLTLIGVALVALGFSAGDSPEIAVFAIGAGTMVLLIAVVALGPIIVGPIHRLLGALPELMFGVPAKLASGNARRNPKRTAATTAALMIGVAVVTMVTVVATSAKETQNREIDKQYPADFTVESSVYTSRLPVSVVDKISARPEVAKAAPESSLYVLTGDGPASNFMLSGISPSILGDLIRPDIVSGDLAEVGPGTVAISDEVAQRGDLRLGSDVTVKASNVKDGKAGPAEKLTVVALFKSVGSTSAYTDMSVIPKLWPETAGYDNVLVKLNNGVSAGDGRTAVEQSVADVPVAKVTGAAEAKDELNSQVNSILALIWALIGLAVVIALFGIANTLTLSVLERTRESALLRALGLTKGQLRFMLVIESILMALMGAIIGVVMGSVFAWLMIKAMSQDSFELVFSVPVGQVLVLLVAAALAAVLAAALPARRAARASIVAGMAEA